MEGRRAGDRNGAREGIQAGDVQSKTETWLLRRQAGRARRDRRSQFGRRQRAGPQFHRGLEPSRYGRPGRIPGSCNVSAATLLDPATKAFVPSAEAEAKFA